MVPDTLDDVEHLHLKPRVLGHAAESTEQAMFFRTQSVLVIGWLHGAHEVAYRHLQSA